MDEYSAGIVKRIFSMTIEGMGPYQIASRLKEEKVLIPSAYLATHNEGVNKNKTFKDVYGWGSSTIVNILDKREYLGHTVNFKTRKHFKDKKSHYVPEDEWTIFEDTHEAIIDQETFDLAKKVRSKVRRYPDGWGEVAPLTGLMYCADCGGKMYVHRTNNGKRISQYTCSQYTKVPCGTLCKTQHRINESVVLELISDLLKAIAEYAQHDRAEFVRVVQEAQDSHFASDVKKKRNRLTAAQNRLNELEVLLCKIYEDNILGKLPDARYATLDAQYGKEQAELKSEVKALEEFLESHEKNKKSAERFISLIEKYENFDNLTISHLTAAEKYRSFFIAPRKEFQTKCPYPIWKYELFSEAKAVLLLPEQLTKPEKNCFPNMIRNRKTTEENSMRLFTRKSCSRPMHRRNMQTEQRSGTLPRKWRSNGTHSLQGDLLLPCPEKCLLKCVRRCCRNTAENILCPKECAVILQSMTPTHQDTIPIATSC